MAEETKDNTHSHHVAGDGPRTDSCRFQSKPEHCQGAQQNATASSNEPTLKSRDRSPVAGTPPPATQPASSFPDGTSKAWLTVLGAWFCYFTGFGWISSIGIFQTYYSQHQLRTYTYSSVAWILSVEVFMLQTTAPLFGKLFDSYGPRGIVILGTVLHVLGLMMVSVAGQYYSLFLAQSVCSGIGAAALYHSSTNAVSTWFEKKRALVLGIIGSGSSFGGLVLPIIFERLVGRIGFGWTMRTIAFIFLGFQAVGLLTVTSRLEHTPKRINIREFTIHFKDVTFLLNAFGCFFFFWGTIIPLNFLVLSAESQGISANLAGYLTAVFNGVSIIGRLVPPYLADKFGRFNITIVTNVFTVIFNLALWIPAKENAGFVAYSACVGIMFGAFASLIPALVAQISDVKQIGVRIGTTFFVISFSALTAQPIAGALIERADGVYMWLQVFCGVSVFIGGALLLCARASKVGWHWKARF